MIDLWKLRDMRTTENREAHRKIDKFYNDQNSEEKIFKNGYKMQLIDVKKNFKRDFIVDEKMK